MRLGVLDIGSNTGHLLVVDAARGAAPSPAYKHKEPLRLAEHLDASGAVTDTGVEALAFFVASSVMVAEDKGCEDMLGFATSAVRDATNSDDVLAHVREHIVRVGCVAHRRGREPEHVLAALVLGHHQRRRDERHESFHPGIGHRPRLVEVLGEPQRLLVLERRARRGTACRVHHQQVPRVGADVEHAQPHDQNTRPCRGDGSSRRSVPPWLRLTW